MDFSRRQADPRRHLTGIAVVILLHLIVLYALVTGLAKKVVDVVRAPIETKVIEEVKKPPPPPEVLLRRRPRWTRRRRVHPAARSPDHGAASPPTISAVTQTPPPTTVITPQAPPAAPAPAAPPAPKAVTAAVACANYSVVNGRRLIPAGSSPSQHRTRHRDDPVHPDAERRGDGREDHEFVEPDLRALQRADRRQVQMRRSGPAPSP